MNAKMKYFTTNYMCSSYRTIEIQEVESPHFVKLYENLLTHEWSIMDYCVDINTSEELLMRAKMYSDYISISLNEYTNQSLIDFFRRNKIRVKMQINFE